MSSSPQDNKKSKSFSLPEGFNLNTLLKNLKKSDLLDQAIVEELVKQQQISDADQLAKALLEDELLTRFQLRAVVHKKTRGLTLGNYVVLDKIGEGGMGIVFKARHRRLDRIVALKVLPRESKKNALTLARFLREAITAAKLSHPNIVAVHDSDDSQGYQFLVMEYVEGKDLSITVKRGGPLSPSKAVDTIIQAAKGLEYSHDQGIIHRDIKPANLLLDVNGTVKILDMGLARIEEQEDTQAELTQEGAIMGTVDYMPPEQAIDVKSVDRRADLYSLGCTLYYLLTGKAVFDGDSLLVKMLGHREQTPPDLTQVRQDVHPQLNLVFQKLLAKSPDDRCQTATELIADLEAILPNVKSFENSHDNTPPSIPTNYADSDASLSHVSQSMPEMFQTTAHTFETQSRPRINLSQYSPKVQMIRGIVIACFVMISAVLIYSLLPAKSEQGTLVVETNSANIKALTGKKFRITHTETNSQYVLTLESFNHYQKLDVGTYSVQPESEPEMKFPQPRFTIRKGLQSKLLVSWTPKPNIVSSTPGTPSANIVDPKLATPSPQASTNQPLDFEPIEPFDFEASYSGQVFPKSIAVDDSGNIYTTGFFINSPDFSPGSGIVQLRSAGSKDIYVSAMDNRGKLLWAKSMGGVEDDIPQSIAVDTNNYTYTTGAFTKNLRVDSSGRHPPLSGLDKSNAYVSALDRNGNLLWASKLMGNSPATGQGVAVDNSNNVYLSGNYDGTLDSSIEMNNSYLTGLSRSGNPRSNFAMGGKSLEFAPKIASDFPNRVYGAGLFKGAVSLDASPSPIHLKSKGEKDLFILAYQQNKLTWVKQVGGNAQFKIFGTTLDSKGNVYTTGLITGIADFDTRSTSVYLGSREFQSLFILAHDRDGKFLWAKDYGGTGIDFSSSIVIDDRGNFYIAGTFTGTTSLHAGPNSFSLQSEGYRDAFIMALDAQGKFSWAVSFGGRYADNISDLALDKQDNLYLTGTCRTTPKFKSDIDASIFQFSDAYVAKIILQNGKPVGNTTTSITQQTPAVNPIADTTLSNTQSPINTLGNLLFATAGNSNASLSPDGLTIYWTREGGTVKVPEIWSSTRKTMSDSFEPPRKIATGVRNATVGPNGLEMIAMDATANQPALVTAQRENLSDTFTQFLPLASISSIPKPDSPSISNTGNILLFQRDNKSTARGVDFVYSTRNGLSGDWSSPQIIPMAEVPLVDKSVSGPCLVDEGLTLWFSQGKGRDAYIMQSTRANFTDTFRKFGYLKVNGEKIHGRFPRYIEATGELFYSVPTKSNIVGTWELAVVQTNGQTDIEGGDAASRLTKAKNPNFDPSFVHEIKTLAQMTRALRTEYVRLLKLSPSTKKIIEIERLLSSSDKRTGNLFNYSIALELISESEDQAVIPLMITHILTQTQNKSTSSGYSIIRSYCLALSSYTKQTLSYSSISATTPADDKATIMLGKIRDWLIRFDEANPDS